MRVPRRDWFASLCVAAAVIAYAAWLVVSDQPGETSVRLMAGAVMALGVAASMAAVVPGFEELLHSSKLYLVVVSLIGLAASVAGVLAVTGADKAMLAGLVALTLVMWVMATLRHVLSTGADRDRDETTSLGERTDVPPRVLVDHSPFHRSSR